MDWELMARVVLVFTISICIAVFTFFIAKLLLEIQRLVRESRETLSHANSVAKTVDDGLADAKNFLKQGAFLKVITHTGLLASIVDLVKKANKKRKTKKEN